MLPPSPSDATDPSHPPHSTSAAGPPPARSAPMRRRPSRLAASLGVLTGLAIVGAVAFVVSWGAAGVGDAERLAHRPATPNPAAAATTPQPLALVADSARGQVVTIEVDTDLGARFGSGWLLDGRGDIVTNDHVVARQRALRVVDRGGGVHTAHLVGLDAIQDIAVLRIAEPMPLEPLGASPEPASVGVEVVVLASGRATMHEDSTIETVARLHGSITVNPEPGDPGAGDVRYDDMIVLAGGRIYQGNSGGPVLDTLGRVIGIVTATSADLPEAYAIPILRVIDELHAFASRVAPAA